MKIESRSSAMRIDSQEARFPLVELDLELELDLAGSLVFPAAAQVKEAS